MIKNCDYKGYSFSIKNGEHLFEQGDKVIGLYLLDQGKWHFARTMRNGKRQLLLPFVDKDMVVGFSEFLSKQSQWHYYVEAVESGSVTFVPKAEFVVLCEKIPELFQALTLDLVHQQAGFQQRLIDTLGRNSGERIAYSLMHIQEKLRSTNLPMNNNDLADLTGSTHVTVCRQLNRLKRNKVINRFNGLLSLDAEKLDHMYNPIS